MRTVKARLFVLLVAALSVACGQTLLATPQAQADIPNRVFTDIAGSRHYLLHVPPGRTAGRPLMVYLHGCNDSLTDSPPGGLSLTRVADEMGFVLVYPLQDRAANSNVCWPWESAQTQQRDLGEPAIIAGITQSLVDELRLDRTRVYLGGYSAGGAITTSIGANYPDLYAAIAPMAAVPFRAQPGGEVVNAAMGPRARAMPAFFLQTTFDEISIYPIGRANLDQWLAADNLADRGSVGLRPSGLEELGPAQGAPAPTHVEHYVGRGGCELAQFITPVPAEHIIGARLMETEAGIELQRRMMRFLLAHRMTPPHRSCG